jgi:hypothetical protein
MVIMVTISIAPYAFRKVLILVAAIVSLSSVSCFAGSFFLSVNTTPYDRQMSRIRPVLSSKSGVAKEDLSLTVVNHWIEGLRAIPYGFFMEWKTPSEVESGAMADCKGKAVALYNLMHSRGAENLRLVIGKRMWTSQKTHAWLEWTTAGGTYVLDPTINWAASPADQLGKDSYIPLYAYAGSQKYRAATPTLYANSDSISTNNLRAPASAPAAK